MELAGVGGRSPALHRRAERVRGRTASRRGRGRQRRRAGARAGGGRRPLRRDAAAAWSFGHGRDGRRLHRDPAPPRLDRRSAGGISRRGRADRNRRSQRGSRARRALRPPRRSRDGRFRRLRQPARVAAGARVAAAADPCSGSAERRRRACRGASGRRSGGSGCRSASCGGRGPASSGRPARRQASCGRAARRSTARAAPVPDAVQSAADGVRTDGQQRRLAIARRARRSTCATRRDALTPAPGSRDVVEQAIAPTGRCSP